MHHKPAAICARLFALTIITLPALSLGQGTLTPPGAPAPTMKTLDQVEPRIAINATNTPGNATTQFVISAPGSYYVSGNIAGVSGKHGIEITSQNVTIDLSGFTLQGVAGSLDGIHAVGANCTIRNGTVADFDQDGIDITTSQNGGLVEQVHARNNGANGILAGAQGVVVRACTGDSNGSVGIVAGFLGSSVTGCTAKNNSSTGISAGLGSAVAECAANNNNGDGISAGSGSTVTGCTARANGGNGINAGDGSTLANCTARFNFGANGIIAGEGSTLNGCTAHGNEVEFGIRADDRSTLTNCTAALNTSDAADSRGISAGAQCTISNCSVDGNLNTNGTPTNSTGGGILAGAVNGINVSGTRANISVLNGSVNSWGGDGINGLLARNSQYRDLRLSGNTSTGLNAGVGSSVLNCTARTNFNGISAGLGGTITGCTAEENFQHGFSTDSGSTITACSAYLNQQRGFSVGFGSTVKDCSALSNVGDGIFTSFDCTVTNCTARRNDAIGINASTGNIVNECTVGFNGSHGITIESDCLITKNNCRQNGRLTGDGAGIRATGSNNRIDDNNSTANTYGFSLGAGGNILIRNTARASTQFNYLFSGSSTFGPIVGAGAITTDNPWANFSY